MFDEPNYLPDLVGTIQQLAHDLKTAGIDESLGLTRAALLLKRMGNFPLTIDEDGPDDSPDANPLED